MLIEFRVSNYRSFADEQVLSLVAGRRDRSHPEHTLTTEALGDLRLLRSALLYGPNGGGKSNLCRAIALVAHFVSRSATEYQAGDEIPVEPFRLDPVWAVAPSRFELTFLQEGVRYQYGFAADRERVHEEWLLAYPQGRARRLFERGAKEEGGWYFGPHLRGDRRRIAELTRPNALFLSVAAQSNHTQLLPVFRWLEGTLGAHCGVLAKFDPTFDSMLVRSALLTALRCDADPRLQTWVKHLLAKADVGIRGLLVERIEPDNRRSGVPRFHVQTVHGGGDGEAAEVRFEIRDESRGTQDLFGLAGPLLEALTEGQVLVLDEQLANLHPALVQWLFGIVHGVPADVPSQILATTHDTTLLDPELVRRDQVWFIEKDRRQASTLYSLVEFRPRRDAALAKGYLAGRYGAIPYLGQYLF